MEELKKQHLEMLQLLESIEVMLQNGESIHPDSVIRGAIQIAIGMEVDVTNVNDKCDNKQTAVEWLEQRIRVKLTYEQDVLFEELFDQAKEMEKEQIINAFNKGEIQGVKSTNNYYYSSLITAEQYYNETFKLE